MKIQRFISIILNPFHRFAFRIRGSKLMYSTHEASEMTGLSVNEIYQMISKGEVKATQIVEGGNYRISKDEVDRLLSKA